jgi:DNA-binding CsgD family transcriptional regulator
VVESRKKRRNNEQASAQALFSPEQLVQVAATLADLLRQQQPNTVRIPLSIFAARLSPAEALVKYLKEQEKLRYADIARLLNRDQRGIWCTYQRAQKKLPGMLSVPPSPHTVPATAFQDRTLSILEHVVHHLRAQNIPLKNIAQLVNKSPSTITTVHGRARRKLQ